VNELECDTAIIGGGVVGLSLAMNLAMFEGRGNNICLFESNYLGYGSSLRNAGRFRVHFGDERNLEFAIRSAEYLEELSKITGMNTLITKTGYLWIASDEAAYKTLKSTNELFKKWGVPLTEIPPELLYRNYPFLKERKEIIAGFFGKENGSIHPDSVIFGLERKARRLGVKILERSRVEEIEVKEGKVHSLRSRGVGVSVSRVVLANGAWMLEFSKNLQLNIPLEPVRKEIAVSEPFAFRISPFVVDSALHLYFSQTLKGEIIGSTTIGNEPKGVVELENRFAWMRTYANRLKKALKGSNFIRIIRIWSGYYEMTPDRSHIMGRMKSWPEGLYAIGGFSGHGFMLGPFAGKLMAEFLATGKEPRLMSLYTPERFSKGMTLNESFVIG
jgi:sarcosine oxidase subunit beta